MRRARLQRKPKWPSVMQKVSCLPVIVLILLGSRGQTIHAQAETQEDLTQRIQKLTEAMARTQAQLELSQREMEEMRRQLAALQQQVAKTAQPEVSSPASQPSPPQVTAEIDALSEKQTMQEAQIATHEQTKVESESKYPLKLSGLLLINSFVNTKQVDLAPTPTVAIGGPGSTGASVRQTLLGLDAHGPHLFGARILADVRVDFYAGVPSAVDNSANTSIAAYSSAYGRGNAFLRLRTVHAALDWDHTQAFFSLDRPILNPDTPSSLIALAVPALAWSGNLWAWNPQAGVAHNLPLRGSTRLNVQAALIDAADGPVSPLLPPTPYQSSTATPVSATELSRQPGSELRIALQGSKLDESAHLGVGGYFAPHRTSDGYKFDSWASSLDYRLPLPGRLALTGNAYRGLALGGLGAGGYKDYVYSFDPHSGETYHRALDDVGGWSQLKERFSERLEFNAAAGIDELFAGQLRPYAGPYTATYQNLARNRTYTGNVIFSPSAYLLFSLEYRHLDSSPVVGSPAQSNIIGLGAGYKF
jgi:hypothetical protein